MSLKGKTPTFSGHKLQDKYPFQGLQISIENKAGSTRKWEDRNGKTGKTKMKYDYGYIKRTLGKDNDHIDCYIGPDHNSEIVFVVHQRVNKKHDEDKVMLGFSNEKDAKEAFLAHYDSDAFWGGCTTMTIDELKDKIIGKKVNKIVKAVMAQTKKKYTMKEARAIGEKLGLDWKKYKPRQFWMGLNVELEHGKIDKKTNVTGDDDVKTAKIALAHLNELPDYYTRLEAMEEEGKKALVKSIVERILNG